jgi:pyruvate/2-oxoglutarate dehydrogenase complex dihydrolipoamide acyltransferase (E2) component
VFRDLVIVLNICDWIGVRLTIDSDCRVSGDPETGASLAVPAVRGLLKSHGVNILEVNGTGKDGRVMKEHW